MTLRWQISVSESLDKGSRGYMEDFLLNHIEEVDGKCLFGIFGVFDGHGGSDAAYYVKTTLVEELKRNSNFWSSDNDEVLIAIKESYSRIQNKLWVEREKWPQAVNGYKSTAGTTATIAIIRNDTVFVGHVGDSAIVLLNQDELCLKSHLLTKEHKPEDEEEKNRIERSGGCLKRKSGIMRIVWNRKKSPYRNDIEQVPFLAVARSLGDLWSYDPITNCYHVSPEPDVMVLKLNPAKHRGLILASDGVWNVIDSDTSVDLLNVCDLLDHTINGADVIVQYSLYQWKRKKLRSDNISALVVRLMPEGYEIRIIEAAGNDRLKIIEEEVVENNLIKKHEVKKQWKIIGSVDNLSEFIPTTVEVAEDTEILRTFVLASDKLARHCIAWRDDSMYWEKLKYSFGEIGMPGLPSIVLCHDCGSNEFETMLSAFSWAVTCLKCLNNQRTSISNSDIVRISVQSLLSDFWKNFYRIIVSPNLCFTIEKLTKTSVFDTTMNHILAHKAEDIKQFIGREMGCHTLQSMFSLKRCQTFSNGVRHCDESFSESSSPTSSSANISQNIVAHFKLKRSSSLQLSQLTITPQISTNHTSLFNSSSSTPTMSPIYEAASTTMITDEMDFHKPILSRKRGILSLSGKVNVSKNLCKLSIVPVKRGETLSEKKIMRYVPRKKRKSN